MKHINVLACAVAAALAIPAAAWPFGTIYGLGQSGEHERITRAGLAGFGFGGRTMDQIAGRRGSFGAVGAPDNPARGLMSAASAHCDGADTFNVAGYPQSARQARARLEACRTLIRSYLDIAVLAAGRLVDASGRIDDAQVPTLIPCVFLGRPGRAKCDVLEALGLAFHASQDFYAHSNWVDRPAAGGISPSNPPGLGRSGRSPWLDPRLNAAFPAGLITGCYEGTPESLHCTYGDNALRVRHAALNKDDGEINLDNLAAPQFGQGTTARGALNGNFQRAAQAAVDDTHDKWAWFEDQVRARYGVTRGRVILCVVLNDRPDVCR